MRASLETLRGKRKLIGCEIGVSFGENAKDILDNLDIAKIYLVDPLWLSEKNFLRAKDYLKKYLHKIVWIGKRSEDVTLKEIPYDSLDFCYIDGSHEYHDVKKDLKLYWPRVKVGGLCAGHDYERKHTVALAVKEFFKGKKEIFSDTTSVDWWVYK